MHAHKMLNVECTCDDVVIAGVKINKPSGVSVKQWVDYWERLCILMEREKDGVYPFAPSGSEEDSEE